MHRVLKILWRAFATEDHGEVNRLHGDEGQRALDVMQEVKSRTSPVRLRSSIIGWIDQVLSQQRLHKPDQQEDPCISKEVRALLLRRLQKLSCEALLLPSQIVVENVERTGHQTYGGGGFADVYCGALGGSPVAIKHLRTFKAANPSEEPRIKKVSSPNLNIVHLTNSLSSCFIERLSCGST